MNNQWRKNMNQNTFITRNEMIDILRISSSTLSRYMNEGLPYFKFKGRVLFDNDKIQDFLKENSFEYESYQKWKLNNKNMYNNS